MLHKITVIGFELANAELLPYLARDVRATIDADRCDDMRLAVADAVGRWFEEAIPQAKPVKELSRDADTDFDLAGR